MMPRNQIIAQTTYQLVAKLEKSEDETLNKSYATIVHKLPAMILQNGLSQTTGFLLAKAASEAAHQQILEHLLVTFQEIDDDFKKVQSHKDFHQAIIASNLIQIMRYTREALEISGWLRRYVQGVLKRDATGDTQDVESEGGEQ